VVPAYSPGVVSAVYHYKNLHDYRSELKSYSRVLVSYHDHEFTCVNYRSYTIYGTARRCRPIPASPTGGVDNKEYYIYVTESQYTTRHNAVLTKLLSYTS